ncbi:MAG: hypothetical protein NTY97_02485 [Planctomycetota bacterium]|nr:hypothetical protein [Planctomycetota bacterium]
MFASTDQCLASWDDSLAAIEKRIGLTAKTNLRLTKLLQAQQAEWQAVAQKAVGQAEWRAVAQWVVAWKMVAMAEYSDQVFAHQERLELQRVSMTVRMLSPSDRGS